MAASFVSPSATRSQSGAASRAAGRARRNAFMSIDGSPEPGEDRVDPSPAMEPAMPRPAPKFRLLLLASLSSAAGTSSGAEFHVHDFLGDDFTGTGTEAAPWATITRGIAAASAGDVVHVGPGVYDASGETFPIAVPPGVSIRGAGAHLSVIDGAGVAWVTQDAMVLLQGSAEVSGLRFRNGPTAFWWDSAISAWGPGDYVIRNNVFEGPNQNRALVISDGSATPATVGSALIEGNVCHEVGPADAMLVFDVPQVVVRQNTIVGSGRAGIVLVDINLNATGSLSNNIFVRNAWYGADVRSPGVTLDHNCFFQNAVGEVNGTPGAVTNTVVAEPRFVAEAMADLHLLPSSPLRDAGAAAGGTTDIDGQAFGSAGAGPDIGADEVAFPGLHLRDAAEPAVVSTFVTIGGAGDPFLLFVGLLPASVPTAHGIFGLDPASMVQLGSGVLSNGGAGVVHFAVPPIASIFGLPLRAQSLAGFGPQGLTAPLPFELVL